MPLRAFFLVLFVLPLIATTAAGGPILGLDSFLTRQSLIDPRASNDSFSSLPHSIKSSLSRSYSPASPLSLLSLSLSLSLHIKLIGSSFSSSSPSLLSSFLSSAQVSSHFHVISPFIPHRHRLALKHSPHPEISLASSSLSSYLKEAIGSEIAKTPSSLRSPLLSIPHSVVDNIIKKDYEKETPVHEVYIYLINLGPQEKKYAYDYGLRGDSPAYTRCLGSIWTGRERYIWVDLAAGPLDYGPGLSGDGVLPKGEFHPLATAHGRPKSEKAMLADLASLIYSAYQVLLVPSLRIPVPFENSLVVEFIHVYSPSSRDAYGLDWRMIQRTFMDEANDNGLLLRGQTLDFKTYEVNFAECSICSFAVSRSTNSYTSRFLFDNYTLIVSEYLDSKRLHQILSDSAEEFKRVAGILEEDKENRKVLPVYVFDLDYPTLLLLDRYHQSVSFKDMVIAVRTKNTQTVSDYSCNGRYVFTHTRELQRPLTGSILQSMWGVSPTHLSWSPQHNSTLVDYTWSVGQTPFGPFSEISSLSFVQKDSARRNILVTLLHDSIMSANDVLDSISVHGGDRKLLKNHRHVEFTQRWNLFKYKLDKAVSALSRLDFKMALYFLRSSDHDLYAIHLIVYNASQELEASLVCFKDPPFPSKSFIVPLIALSALLYVYMKREKLFKNKRKQF